MLKKRFDNKFSEKEKIRKSLIYSIFDGSFASAMVGFGESFFSAFAIFLKATNFQIGLLGSLPQTLGSLFQLFSTKLIKLFKSRKLLVSIGALLQGLMYIPVALVFLFGEMKIFYLISFICLYWIFGSIVSPAWSSWMGDLVNENERGKYFGKRNRIAGLVSFAAFLIGGYILQSFNNGGEKEYIGFAIIFAIALISRIFSFIFLTMKYEPNYDYEKKVDFTFMDFVKKARFNNYGLFVIYLCCINFAVYVSGPFFSAYMLSDLKMNYMTFTIVNAVSIIVTYLCMPLWGKTSDKYGNKKVLGICGFLISAVPILWTFSTNTIFLIILQIYSGFVWAGFNISAFNFIFDCTSKEKRATCVAYYNVLNGIAIFSGAMFGTFLLRYGFVFWSDYYILFIASFLLRFIASVIFVPKIREVRHVKRISYEKLMIHIFTLLPTMTFVHGLMSLKHKK